MRRYLMTIAFTVGALLLADRIIPHPERWWQYGLHFALFWMLFFPLIETRHVNAPLSWRRYALAVLVAFLSAAILGPISEGGQTIWGSWQAH